MEENLFVYVFFCFEGNIQMLVMGSMSFSIHNLSYKLFNEHLTHTLFFKNKI